MDCSLPGSSAREDSPGKNTGMGCHSLLRDLLLSFTELTTRYWASLESQLVKNPPAMQETPVQYLGQEDLLEKG